MTQLPLSPFIYEPEHRFVLDEAKFMEAIIPEHLPAFLSNPSHEYLTALQIKPIVDVLAGHM